MSSNKLEEILKQINTKKVKLLDEAVAKNNQTLQEVLEAVIVELKRDTLFKALYSDKLFGGSYYEGLKVSKPNEYDINLVLKIPKLASCVISTQEAGHIKLHVNMDEINRQEYLKNHRGLAEYLKDGFLSVQKINSWLQTLIDKAMPKLKEQFDIYLIKQTSSGPARTLVIDQCFCVDLVLAFRFPKESWPNNYKYSEYNKDFYIIPKPIDNEPLLWRCSFYGHEKEILHGLERVKGAIRLLKVLRDEQRHLSELKSYFIKTVFLLEIPRDRERFKKMSLSAVFLEMLEKLEAYVREGAIPFYWNKNLNLLKPKLQLWTDIANSLNTVRFNINRDPCKACKYFNVNIVDQLSIDFSGTHISDDDKQGAMAQEEAGFSLGQKVLIGSGIAVGALAVFGMIASSVNASQRKNK